MIYGRIQKVHTISSESQKQFIRPKQVPTAVLDRNNVLRLSDSVENIIELMIAKRMEVHHKGKVN